MVNYDISVAMATFHGVKYISEQLESICYQTLKPTEVIISDDGSSDGTLEIIDKFKNRLHIKVYTNEKSQGVLKNFSKAISLCSSPYIALCDQDDVWAPSKLQLNLKKMFEIEVDETLPSLVFSDLEIVNENLKVINYSFWKHLNAKPIKDTFKDLLFGNVVTGCSMMINRPMAKYLEETPGDVIMHDYWAALIAYGFGQVGMIEQPLVKYRQHGKNVTNNYERSFINRVTELYKILLKDRREFLQKEILQAKKFAGLFEKKLSTEKQRDLSDFNELENADYLRRKWESFKSNHQ